MKIVFLLLVLSVLPCTMLYGANLLDDPTEKPRNSRPLTIGEYAQEIQELIQDLHYASQNTLLMQQQISQLHQAMNTAKQKYSSVPLQNPDKSKP